MRLRVRTALAAAFLFLAPAASHATLAPYSQNFEALTLADPAALSTDGWVVYGNVYTLAHAYIYGYGTFPAPNGGSAFCGIVTGEGGVDQGNQQMSVYSDYNNADHGNNRLIESNVFHEQPIALADVGNIWTFQFDAKLGNLTGASTALAFIKTVNPAAGFATTNFITADMTSIPTTWTTHRISLKIDASLVGQLLQFGFSNTATGYVSSGVFYDNLTWQIIPGAVGVPGTQRPNVLELRAAAPNPFAYSTRIDYSMAQRSDADLSVYDITGRRVATLFHGEADAGPHVARWDGRAADGRLAPSGVYQCVLQTAAGRETRSLVLSR